MKAWIVLALIFIWQALSGPSMGPAHIVLKISERCNFTVPTMVDVNMRLVQKQGKTMLNLTATLPFKYSDKLGFDLNVAVKRNGAWKPNFFKMRGNGLCNGIKVAQRKLFDMFAKSLHASKPYTCPLPAGSLEVTDYVVDMDGFISLTGASLPYGEFRVNVNMTLKNDIGPANIVMKFSERCNFTVPTMVDFNMRLLQKQGKTMLNLSFPLPFKFSDKIWFDVNIAVKRNGAWKPNFFKMRGNGLCNGIKVAQRKLFDMFAKSLHASKPYTCPLPAGSLEVTDYVVDMDGFKTLTGASLPYGELRANVNMTLKDEIVTCSIFYVDIVPKHTKKNG